MNRVLLRLSAALAIFSTLTLCVMSGCADPHGDYQTYADEAQAKGKLAQGNTSCDVTTTDFNISGQFISYCLAELGGGEPKNSLRLGTVFEQDPGGTIKATLTPLLATATTLNDIADKAVSVTAPFDGPCFSVNFGNVSISGKANALSGSDIEVQDTTLKMKVRSSDNLCAELDGLLIKPFENNFANSKDVCVILRVGADGVLPPLPAADAFLKCP